MKKSIKILADSSCDFTHEQAEKSGVVIVPMSVTFGDTVYHQGIDLSTAEFYEKMVTASVPPITSQLTYNYLEEVYRDAVKDGSEVVAIHLSSALSGTYQSAVIASKKVSGVYAVDSQNATMGSALLVREAVKMRDAGMTASEIVEELNVLVKRVRLYAYVPTLKYLVRGGRVSAIAGMVGTVLNIYPIITVQDGEVKSIGKVKGKAGACKELIRLTESACIDPEYCVVFGHAANLSGLTEFNAITADLVRGCITYTHEVGVIVGTHTGPGAVGLAFVSKI